MILAPPHPEDPNPQWIVKSNHRIQHIATISFQEDNPTRISMGFKPIGQTPRKDSKTYIIEEHVDFLRELKVRLQALHVCMKENGGSKQAAAAVSGSVAS